MFNRNQESILNKTTILFRDQLFSRKPASSNVFLIVEHSNMIENVTFVIVVSIFLREASFFIFYFIFTCTVPTLSLTTIQSKLKNIISLNQRIKKKQLQLSDISCYPVVVAREQEKLPLTRFLLQFHSVCVFLYTYINISCYLPTPLKMTDK